MKIAPIGEIKPRFSAYLDATKEGPVVVTRKGAGITHEDSWRRADSSSDPEPTTTNHRLAAVLP